MNTNQVELNQNSASIPSDKKPHPRCLSTVPADIAELIAQFKKQGN